MTWASSDALRYAVLTDSIAAGCCGTARAEVQRAATRICLDGKYNGVFDDLVCARLFDGRESELAANFT